MLLLGDGWRLMDPDISLPVTTNLSNRFLGLSASVAQQQDFFNKITKNIIFRANIQNMDFE